MTLLLLWLQLAGLAAIILIAANFLTKSADIIAFKTGLGRAFIGVVLLATATSLPELGTGVSSVALVGTPDLAAGDAFGSNVFNLLIIGLLDLFWRRGPILTTVGSASKVVAFLGIILIALAGAAVLIHSGNEILSNWYLSPVSLVMLVVFFVAMYVTYRVENSVENSQELDQELEQGHEYAEQGHEYASARLHRSVVGYLVAASFVVGAAIWLAETGDRLAVEMGWEASFVGTQFLAFSTSLPELAASFAAIRLRAPELAITAVLGSNIFNMGFILFMDDVAFTEGVFWSAISNVHAITAAVAILMTLVVIIGMIKRVRARPAKWWTVEALALIGLYIAGSILVLYLG